MFRLNLLLLSACGRIGFGSDDGATAGESAYRQEVLADGPASYWPFSETSGTTTADVVGQKDGALVGGVTRVQGATNDGDGALAFDGETGRVVIGDYYAFAGTTSYSIELWAKRETVDSMVRWMLDRTSDAVPDVGWQIYTGNDFTIHSRSTGASETGYSGTGQLTPGQWVYLVATYDGTEAKFFRNAVPANNMFSTEPIGGGPGQLVFGDLAKEQFYKFDGAMDEVAIYERPLSAVEVANHYAASGR